MFSPGSSNICNPSIPKSLDLLIKNEIVIAGIIDKTNPVAIPSTYTSHFFIIDYLEYFFALEARASS